MSAKAFVQCAREQIGKPYVWATAGPNSFDCSGLVAYCWEQTQGEPLTRSSHQQFLLGEQVLGSEVRAGDLLFWDTMGDGAGHVAIHVGDGKVVHALNPSRGVIESIDFANMGGPFLGARRLFTDRDEPDPEPVPDIPKPRRRRNRRRRRRNQ